MSDRAQGFVSLLLAVALFFGTGIIIGRTIPIQDAYQTGYDRGFEDMANSLQEALNIDPDVFLRCAKEAFTDKKEGADE